MSKGPKRIVLVTGRLACPALERMIGSLSAELACPVELVVMKISVASLMTTRWLSKQFEPPTDADRVILPGGCTGDLSILAETWPSVSFERGPTDLRDLPDYLHGRWREQQIDDQYDIEILSEINHANRWSIDALITEALRLQGSGADVIDLGATPGESWADLPDAVARLVDEGLRVSIDSFDPSEVERAVAAGAELVLSVNRSNVERAVDWGAEVVVIPDDPHGDGWRDEMNEVADRLAAAGVKHRMDPILEPIGFGFARSLGRYLELRRSLPSAEMLCGVGNLTELTEVDSVGVNTMLIGFCQELGIRSVLTTEVIDWAKSSTAEIDVARRLMHHAITHQRLPKHLDDRLVMLRGRRKKDRTLEELQQLQRQIRDPNFRIFADNNELIAMNNALFETDTDPFELFRRLGVDDPAHAFYLGWEFMKATLAIELGKAYTQDQSLPFGLLTKPERSGRSHRPPNRESVP